MLRVGLKPNMLHATEDLSSDQRYLHLYSRYTYSPSWVRNKRQRKQLKQSDKI